MSGTLRGTVDWFLDGAHWSGPEGVPHRLAEHVGITSASVALACAIALPIGIYLGHRGVGGALATNISNAGRAIPTFAVLVLLAASPVGFGNRAAVVALTLFAVPPVLTNAYVGMRSVDPEVREAARGMGMTGSQMLRRVELPLALPLVAAGIRTSAVQVVATATLAAVVAGGGLGRFIVDGIGQVDQPMVLAGALLVALLALVTELGLGRVQRWVTPGPGRVVSRPGAAAPVSIGADDDRTVGANAGLVSR